MDKRYLYFVKKEHAEERFPGQKIVRAFTGIHGWLWTSEKTAKTKEHPYND